MEYEKKIYSKKDNNLKWICEKKGWIKCRNKMYHQKYDLATK